MYRQYICKVCGHIYDEENGDLESGIIAKTLWSVLSDSWSCSECGASKSDFMLLKLAD